MKFVSICVWLVVCNDFSANALKSVANTTRDFSANALNLVANTTGADYSGAQEEFLKGAGTLVGKMAKGDKLEAKDFVDAAGPLLAKLACANPATVYLCAPMTFVTSMIQAIWPAESVESKILKQVKGLIDVNNEMIQKNRAKGRLLALAEQAQWVEPMLSSTDVAEATKSAYLFTLQNSLAMSKPDVFGLECVEQGKILKGAVINWWVQANLEKDKEPKTDRRRCFEWIATGVPMTLGLKLAEMHAGLLLQLSQVSKKISTEVLARLVKLRYDYQYHIDFSLYMYKLVRRAEMKIEGVRWSKKGSWVTVDCVINDKRLGTAKPMKAKGKEKVNPSQKAGFKLTEICKKYDPVEKEYEEHVQSVHKKLDVEIKAVGQKLWKVFDPEGVEIKDFIVDPPKLTAARAAEWSKARAQLKKNVYSIEEDQKTFEKWARDNLQKQMELWASKQKKVGPSPMTKYYNMLRRYNECTKKRRNYAGLLSQSKKRIMNCHRRYGNYFGSRAGYWYNCIRRLSVRQKPFKFTCNYIGEFGSKRCHYTWRGRQQEFDRRNPCGRKPRNPR
eukprot:TRINITY_DN14975_c0_g1_i1.p1 TRINITY_DN14975_c0_g1~~TRINITY_DN14975_c0_g1_i1.p1  ORF type:complete len:559 (+),score=85.09 TRINITY_DN14975_c0_g1_i1:93-1769(+)